MNRWLQRLVLCIVLVAAFSGCVTPSVPIPPPEPEKIFFALDGDAGEATFRYDPAPSYAGAIVYVFNRDVGQGIITTAESDGSVTTTDPFPAFGGDEIVVTFETDQQLSSTCVKVQDGQSNSGLECSP